MAKPSAFLCTSYVVLAQLISINHATPIITTGTAPTLRSSVDGYKTVCSNEVVYLTCSASGCWSLTWTSPTYIGTRTAIEFNQDHDRPGDGKLVSLASGRATLAQISKTETTLSSDLKTIVANGAQRTAVTCTNDILEAVTTIFNLANEPPSPPATEPIEYVAESINDIKVYRFRWAQPENIDRIDLSYYEFRVGNQRPLTLTNQSTELVLDLEMTDCENVSIVAVDRCGQRSQPASFRLGDRPRMTHTEAQAELEVTEKVQIKQILQKDDKSSSTRLDVLFSFILFIALSVLSL